jgi:hypothetical protein
MSREGGGLQIEGRSGTAQIKKLEMGTRVSDFFK